MTIAPAVARTRPSYAAPARRRRSAVGRRSAVAGFARTGPGRLSLLTLGLVLLSVLAGFVLSSTASKQATQLSTLTGRTEALAGAAQDLYSALSEADAAAASAFLAGGLEPAALRERYTRSINTAAASLGAAAAGTGTDTTGRLSLAQLSTQLPVYTGLIETARANNQQGFPVGSAYLREASTLMQSTLLPAANQLYQDYSAASARQSHLPRLPWLGLALGLVALSLPPSSMSAAEPGAASMSAWRWPRWRFSWPCAGPVLPVRWQPRGWTRVAPVEPSRSPCWRSRAFLPNRPAPTRR